MDYALLSLFFLKKRNKVKEEKALIHLDLNYLATLVKVAEAQQQERLRVGMADVAEDDYEDWLPKEEATIAVKNIVDYAIQAAPFGQRQIIALELGEDQYAIPGTVADRQTCHPQWVKGMAKLVFEQLKEIGFNSRIEYWHNGHDGSSGFRIMISW